MALITLARFNNLRSRIATILGTGSGDSGYGQTLPSGISAALTGNPVITNEQHDRTTGLLRGVDMIKYHQLNTAVTVTAPEPANGTLILDSLYTTLETEMTNLESSPNRFRLSTDAAQSTNTEVVNQTIASGWTGSRTHTTTVTFASANDARYFFNAGGEIRFSFQVNYSSGGTVDATKNGRWKNLIDRRVTSGLVYASFGYTATTVSGTGTGSAIGWYDLTTSAQTIFTKIDTGTYSGNDIAITASRNAGSTAITFVTTFNDDGSTGVIDESVSVTFNSYVNSVRATGSYVSVSQPTFGTSSA